MQHSVNVYELAELGKKFTETKAQTAYEEQSQECRRQKSMTGEKVIDRNAKQFFDDLLRQAHSIGASDIHIKVGLPPVVRINGTLRPMSREHQRLKPKDTLAIAEAIVTGRSARRFEKQSEVDMGYGLQGVGRFRLNIFRQRGTVSIVARAIPYDILSIDDLGLPAVVKRIANEPRGLVLVTGATGSGKSTTLAAIVDHINSLRTAHIITVEDPIEFLIRDRKSIITQREIGLDTLNFAEALKYALRQDPDVILVGEMRDYETMRTAMQAADTGHLVLSTMHTNDATETINRILSTFPPHEQEQARAHLASILKAVISQRLIGRMDQKGRVLAAEILISNTRVRESILDRKKTSQIHQIIEESGNIGMRSFDQSLMDLVKTGKVTYEAALTSSSNPGDFELRFRGVAAMDGAKWNPYDGGISANEFKPEAMDEIEGDTINVETVPWSKKKA